MSADLLALILKANLAASAAILAVLLSRRLLRRLFGPGVAYAAWASVPLAAAIMLMPGPVQPTSTPAAAPATAAPAVPAPAVEPPAIAMPAAPNLPSLSGLTPALLALWLIGAGGFLTVQAIRQARFVAGLGRLRREREEGVAVHRAETPGVGPAVVGVLRPRIVLPADFHSRFDAGERAVLLAHERNHLAAGDAQINALVLLLRGLCWFNPLVHLAAARLRIDQELACDAAVVARFPAERRRYGELMLRAQLQTAPLPLGCQWLGQGPAHLKERIAMLKQDRPGLGRRLAGIATIGLASLGLAVGAWSAQPPRPAGEVLRPGAHGQALFDAVRDGDSASAEALIAEGADVNARLRGDGTPLIEAARVGREDLVAMLLAAGADPNLALPREGNPLIVAAAHGHLDVVRRLVEAGAQVDAFVINDETPLINAARSGRLEVVAYLVDRGADVNLAVQAGSNAVQSKQVRAPLSEARRFGRTEIVNYLISRGARG
jgi:beta-lactamase regulating signal transducer with metallopeptidase domain